MPAEELNGIRCGHMNDQEWRGLVYDLRQSGKERNGDDKGHMKNHVSYGSLSLVLEWPRGHMKDQKRRSSRLKLDKATRSLSTEDDGHMRNQDVL